MHRDGVFSAGHLAIAFSEHFNLQATVGHGNAIFGGVLFEESGANSCRFSARGFSLRRGSSLQQALGFFDAQRRLGVRVLGLEALHEDVQINVAELFELLADHHAEAVGDLSILGLQGCILSKNERLARQRESAGDKGGKGGAFHQHS